MSEVRREDVLGWLDEAFAALRSAHGSLLSVDGVDVLEALRSPLYTAVLKAARAAEAPEPETLLHRLAGRAHRYKQLGQEMTRSHRSISARQTADVVLWPRTAAHVKQIAPVYRALVEAEKHPLLLVSQPRIADAVRAQGLHAVHAWTELWPKLISAHRQGKGAAHRWVKTAVKGEPRPWADALHREVGHQLPLIHELTAIVRNIQQRAQPSLFVVGNDLTPEGRTACLALAGITPVACLMHGIGSGNPLLGHHLADRILVYGEIDREHLRELGFAEERVRVIGAPYLDDLPRQRDAIDPSLEQLGLKAPVVLMAVSGPGDKVSLDHHRSVIAAMHRASREIFEASFVAKLHPKDKLEHYQEESPLRAVAAGTQGLPGDIFVWLQGVRVLVTGGSAVAMEAMLLDVPVVTADFEGTLGGIDFIEAGATLHARNADELVAAIAMACRDPEATKPTRAQARRYLERKLGPLDGRASQRAVEALEQMR